MLGISALSTQCFHPSPSVQVLLLMFWLVLQEEYELDNGTALVSLNAPRHWRHRHEVHQTGAFHQLHVRF